MKILKQEHIQSLISMRSYSQTGLKETFRKLFRGVDFVILFLKFKLYSKKKDSIFVEFGAGPIRLSSIKKIMFSETYNIDHRYYFESDGIDKMFFKVDINDIDKLKKYLISFKDKDVTVFADHCFEYIALTTFEELIGFFIEMNFKIVFRVPNIYSSQGKRNYDADSTHQIPFNNEIRESLHTKGFKIQTWNRWYKIDLFIDKLFSNRDKDFIFNELLCFRQSIGK